MLLSMMEPHLAAIGADTYSIGITFLIFGLVFAIATPLAGLVRKLQGVSKIIYILLNPLRNILKKYHHTNNDDSFVPICCVRKFGKQTNLLHLYDRQVDYFWQLI
jgi:hypothetical protein